MHIISNFRHNTIVFNLIKNSVSQLDFALIILSATFMYLFTYTEHYTNIFTLSFKSIKFIDGMTEFSMTVRKQKCADIVCEVYGV